MSTQSSIFDQVNKRLFRRSIGWTGIEIGCHEVKMAQVCKLNGRWRLSSIWSIENPVPYKSEKKELPPDRPHRDPESFGWTTPKDVLEHGLAPLLNDVENLSGLFQGKKCAATLSDGMIAYRELDLPICDPSEARSIVYSEVALEAECDPNELITDCWQLPNSRSRSETSSYAAVSMKSIVAEQMALDLLKIGFDCQAMDAMPCVLARATQMMIENEKCVTLAIDLGYSQTTITLVQNGGPVLTRSLRNCGLLSLLESVAKSFEVSLFDAQTLLFQSSTVDKSYDSSQEKFSNPLRHCLESYLQALSIEINKTIEYSDRAFHSIAPEVILLMGAGVKIPFVAKILEQKTSLPTLLWDMDVSNGQVGSLPIGSFAVSAALSSLAWGAT